jgi:hypothetical protein
LSLIHDGTYNGEAIIGKRRRGDLEMRNHGWKDKVEPTWASNCKLLVTTVTLQSEKTPWEQMTLQGVPHPQIKAVFCPHLSDSVMITGNQVESTDLQIVMTQFNTRFRSYSIRDGGSDRPTMCPRSYTRPSPPSQNASSEAIRAESRRAQCLAFAARPGGCPGMSRLMSYPRCLLVMKNRKANQSQKTIL